MPAKPLHLPPPPPPKSLEPPLLPTLPNPNPNPSLMRTLQPDHFEALPTLLKPYFYRSS